MLILKDRKIGAACLSFSPDGTQLAVGGYRGLVQVWNLARQEVVHTLPGCKEIVTTLFYLSSEELLGQEQQSLHLWDLSTSAYRGRRPRGKAVPIDQVAYAPTAQALFLACCRDVWTDSGYRTEYRCSRRSLPKFSVAWRNDTASAPLGQALACTRDGAMLAGGSVGGSIEFYDGSTGKPLPKRIGGEVVPDTTVITFSPDEQSIAWCAATHLRLWRLDPAEEVKHTVLGKTHFLGLSWHPSGRFFATCNGDGKVDYWDGQTGERLESFDWKVGKLHDVGFDATGDRAACCSKSGEIVVWDVDR